MMVDQN
jgi:Glucosidase II beta subunit-like protein